MGTDLKEKPPCSGKPLARYMCLAWRLGGRHPREQADGVKTVFADTSAFYAAMDNADPFHREAVRLFRTAVVESWRLATTNYVVHESWALIQRRLGLDALRDFERGLLSLCELIFVDAALHRAAVQRCLTANRRNLSLTDCVSLKWMQQEQVAEAIARDVHFFCLGR